MSRLLRNMNREVFRVAQMGPPWATAKDLSQPTRPKGSPQVTQDLNSQLHMPALNTGSLCSTQIPTPKPHIRIVWVRLWEDSLGLVWHSLAKQSYYGTPGIRPSKILLWEAPLGWHRCETLLVSNFSRNTRVSYTLGVTLLQNRE